MDGTDYYRLDLFLHERYELKDICQLGSFMQGKDGRNGPEMFQEDFHQRLLYNGITKSNYVGGFFSTKPPKSNMSPYDQFTPMKYAIGRAFNIWVEPSLPFIEFQDGNLWPVECFFILKSQWPEHSFRE
ncbi:hypothetical protein AAVH_20579 [Aphelenchoides avenae]|nr:hypothetical protein AAVH_20579 [Aphelenchus avenae]